VNRRTLMQGASALACLALAGLANAQDNFPSKPVRFVIPSAAGGATDVVARMYAERLSKLLKQPVITDNMPGAGTLLAVRHVNKSAPDGYTLVVSANTVVTMPYVDKGAGYMPSDLTGVAYLSRSPMALVVSASSPYKTLADLVAAARRTPGSLTFGSVGVGTTSHLPVELFARTAGIKLELIPYKGIPLAIPDVVSGRVTLMIGTAPSVGELVKAGKMRALAVTSDARSASFPGVPTFSELGYPDATYELFLGLMAPAATPPAVLKVLADAVEQAKKDPELLNRLQTMGQELPTQSSPEQFNAFLRREEARMKKLVRDANIQSAN